MKYGVFFTAATILLFSACGCRGDLYLPREGDKARFDMIQTGLEFDIAREPTTQTDD